MIIESDQLENGYTRIANSLLEKMSKTNLSANCWRALFFVIRESYGHQRKATNPISRRQISKKIKMNNSSLDFAINHLIKIGIILPLKDGSFKFNKYGFNSLQKEAPLPNPLGRQATPPLPNPLGRCLPNPLGSPNIYKEERKGNERKGRGRGETPHRPSILEMGKEGELLGSKKGVSEGDIFKLGEAYLKTKRINLAGIAKETFLKRSGVYYPLKDILTLATGNLAIAIEAIEDLAEYYGNKDWNLRWIADKDFVEWNREREERINGRN